VAVLSKRLLDFQAEGSRLRVRSLSVFFTPCFRIRIFHSSLLNSVRESLRRANNFCMRAFASFVWRASAGDVRVAPHRSGSSFEFCPVLRYEQCQFSGNLP
jgi:hypothetical protein